MVVRVQTYDTCDTSLWSKVNEKVKTNFEQTCEFKKNNTNLDLQGFEFILITRSAILIFATCINFVFGFS